jgi:predicted lactoylglutathione lyase
MMAARSPVRIHLSHLIRKMLGYNVRVFLVQDATFDSTFDEYLRIPRKDKEVVLKATRNPREITEFLVRELQKRGGRSLRLGSYDRGFWARTELERQRLDCFVSLATVDQFAAEGRQSLPDSSVYAQ